TTIAPVPTLSPSRLPPPPRSTLFPYTTLFRSGFDWGSGHEPRLHLSGTGQPGGRHGRRPGRRLRQRARGVRGGRRSALAEAVEADRKSTRLNSSHDQISYAVFCLKKKKKH